MITIAVILTVLIITNVSLFLRIIKLTHSCNEFERRINETDNEIRTAHRVFSKFMMRTDRHIDEMTNLHYSELSKQRKDNE